MTQVNSSFKLVTIHPDPKLTYLRTITFCRLKCISSFKKIQPGLWTVIDVLS